MGQQRVELHVFVAASLAVPDVQGAGSRGDEREVPRVWGAAGEAREGGAPLQTLKHPSRHA